MLRYDCRGYLYDLEPYDADNLTNEKRHPKYTNEEIEIEKTCDQERYMFLKDEDLNINENSSQDSTDNKGT